MKKIIVLAVFAMVSAFASEIDNERLMESKSHQERIKILQEADECIASASTKEDYRKCENYEKSQRGELKSQHFAEKKASISQKIDQHIQNLQIAKNCVDSAKTVEELKMCKKDKKQGN